jgi:putative ATPase
MSNDLFDHAMRERLKSEAPLAARMRPRTVDEYIGQEHIVGEGKLLRRAIQADKLFSSIILWGPPSTSKNTPAQVIANTTKSHFTTISAILIGS